MVCVYDMLSKGLWYVKWGFMVCQVEVFRVCQVGVYGVSGRCLRYVTLGFMVCYVGD